MDGCNWVKRATRYYNDYLEWWVVQRLGFADMSLLEEVHGVGCHLERLGDRLEHACDGLEVWKRIESSSVYKLGFETFWAHRPSDRLVISQLGLLGKMLAATSDCSWNNNP